MSPNISKPSMRAVKFINFKAFRDDPKSYDSVQTVCCHAGKYLEENSNDSSGGLASRAISCIQYKVCNAFVHVPF